MTKETLTQWRKTDPNDQRVLNKQTNKQKTKFIRELEVRQKELTST